MAFSRRVGISFLLTALTACFGLLLFFPSSWVQAGGGGGGGGGSQPTNCPAFSTSPPVLETVSGYTTSALVTLYDKLPSPATCGGGQQGVCITNNFGGTQGTKVAAITATAKNLVFGAPQPMQVTIDAVTTQQSNACGQTATHWSWVATPSASTQTAYFPKNTSVEVSYSCQSAQAYTWQTHTSCFLGIGNCNVKQHYRIFNFATKASSSMASTSSALYGSTTITPQEGKTYTLACGGYRPENSGSGDPPTYGASNINSGVCFAGIDCNGGTDTASYNAKDPSYLQPGITLSVNVCSGDDEVVVNNVCTPCSTIKPGSWRVDNICVSSIPVLKIDALVAGKSVDTVVAGTKVTLQGVYLSTSTDPITAVAINGGTKSSTASVCGSGSDCLQTTYGVKKAVATSTYTFTPSSPGTYTFYPAVQTTVLTISKNYGEVSKTLVVSPPCPSNATPSGNTCTCKDKYFAYIGNSCVLTCPSGMHTNKGGNSCISTLPTAAMIDFSGTRVRSGSSSTLSWAIHGMTSGITCDIGPHASLKTLMPGATPSGSVLTIPITQPTKYTLSCTNGEETVSKDVIVQLIPEYQEI